MMHAVYLTALLGAVVAAAPSLVGRATSDQTAKVWAFLSLQVSVCSLVLTDPCSSMISLAPPT